MRREVTAQLTPNVALQQEAERSHARSLAEMLLCGVDAVLGHIVQGHIVHQMHIIQGHQFSLPSITHLTYWFLFCHTTTHHTLQQLLVAESGLVTEPDFYPLPNMLDFTLPMSLPIATSSPRST